MFEKAEGEAMKTIKAWAVIPKFNEMADIIRNSSCGVMIPFFDSEHEANEWRYRSNRAASTQAVEVEIRKRSILTSIRKDKS